MASKLWVHEPDTFFLFEDTEISEKWNFLVNRSIPENFQRENFSGQVPTESLHTQDSEEGYGLSSRTTTFLQNTRGPNFLFITVFVPGHSRGL